MAFKDNSEDVLNPWEVSLNNKNNAPFAQLCYNYLPRKHRKIS